MQESGVERDRSDGGGGQNLVDLAAGEMGADLKAESAEVEKGGIFPRPKSWTTE